ncbi:ribokinase [Planctomicrobium sp. SH661]|uniref:ribokinase n=1 Tax=Planctomicrobium sp. SH661 TaxID=3448124 RepID=UPI003F5B6441
MINSISRPRIAVVGSINMDLVLQCQNFPKPGETVAARSYTQNSGGKGANQAVSAARAGGAVSMIGRVGNDAFGSNLISSLQSCGVNCEHVQETTACGSGLAFVTVEESGENQIVTFGGANERLSTQDVQALQSVILSCDVVMLQLEVPMETVLAVIKMGWDAGVRVILDPAPVSESFPDELLNVDLICPNEQEAARLAGIPVETLHDVDRAARILHQLGAKHVVVTLGGKGAYLYDTNGGRLHPAFKTTVVDTTAAGDSFIGALAVRWVETGDLDEAVRWGNAAGAMTASRLGAQPSIGHRAEIQQLWSTHP